MEYRELGSTGEKVSVIGVGCWQMGGNWTGMSRERAVKAIHKAKELGINFFDVAPIYGLGEAEKLLGEAVSDFREEIFIASKVGLRWQKKFSPEQRDLTPESMRWEIEESLKRLGTDYIDLYQFHWPDPNEDIEKSLQLALELKQEGKIRYIGLSNFSVPELDKANNYTDIASNQVLFNALEHDPLQYHGIPLEYRTRSEIIPYCEENNISVIPYSPLCQGLLTDSFNIEDWDEDDVRNANPKFKGDWLKTCQNKVDQLKEIARDYGRPLVQLAFNWLRAQPAVTTIIAGTTNPDHVEENAASLEWELSETDLEKIDRILA